MAVQTRKGHIDYPKRVPNGWKVSTSDKWLINNEDPGDRSVFDIANWKLEVYGQEVKNPFSLTYEEFQKLPHVTKTLDHHCVDGWSFLGQVWNGVEMTEIIKRAQVSPQARYVLVEGAGVSQSFSIEDELFLADGQRNSELPRPAGYPLRIVAPGQFGNRSVKWVRKLKFTKEREVDSRDEKYMAYGIYDLFVKGMRDYDPWTVDNNLRKEFLRKLFASNTDVRRKKKHGEYLKSGEGLASTSNGQEIALCRIDELKDDLPSKFIVNGYEILILKTKDGMYAMEPMCTHHGADLSKGKLNLDAKTIRCPLHGAYFDLATGKCLLGSNGCDGDGFPNARTYRFRVESGTILVSKQQEWGSLD